MNTKRYFSKLKQNNLQLLMIASCFTSSFALANDKVEIHGDKVLGGYLQVKIAPDVLQKGKDSVFSRYWVFDSGEVESGRSVYLSRNFSAAKSVKACVDVTTVEGSETHCSASVNIEQTTADSQYGNAPEMTELSFTQPFVFENDTVTLSYVYRDQDCEIEGNEAACGVEDNASPWTDWFVNGDIQDEFQDSLTFDVILPEDWSWEDGLSAFVTVEGSVFSESGTQGNIFSDSYEMTRNVMRDFEDGDNEIEIGDFTFLRPALITDTDYIELTDTEHWSHQGATRSWTFSSINYDKAALHCETNGLRLATEEELTLISGVTTGSDTYIYRAGWPLGFFTYLTNDISIDDRDRKMVQIVQFDDEGNVHDTWASPREHTHALVVCVLDSSAELSEE
ncbi:hypothetical protein [Vibrio paucivorans]|uniref:C-type lectin domain-containing protein n=1 Tax=Vibrio paucivorans TaxID=2829489 RepID=A0A9X3CKY1_9VIBR|nr:hypothetical protein [Vibrio paucivorans]MCW8336620.1 hypothetical protein [Vibrio paucivorans]